MRFSNLGLTIKGDYGLGCGTMLLVDFNFDMTDREYVLKVFEHALKPYRSNTAGIILAVLNPSQNFKYGSILTESGFVLLSTHINYVHDHLNYLYGFMCMDHKPETITEKDRSFG